MHLLIALDGADPKLARKYFKRMEKIGKIKNMKTYLNTGPSFGSALTGLPPKKHKLEVFGIDSNLTTIKGDLIWDKIGSSIGIANVPILWPPIKIRGWMICGMLSPSEKVYTYPAKLTEELNKIGYEIWIKEYPKGKSGFSNILNYLFKSYLFFVLNHPHEALKRLNKKNIKVVVDTMKGKQTSAATPLIDNVWWDNEWKRVIKNRTKGFTYLLNNYPVDIAILCYKALDCIQHRLFHKPKKIEEWYEIQEKEIEKLLNGLKKKPKTITIFSDHGFKGAKRGYITGDHKSPGLLISNVKNNINKIEDIYNFILNLENK